ncbi:hypothetical protein BDD12DRAFT_820503 [Trichophaea hybrida]|nr:hypothetical protein BDD12DRAFT_820503 [Trichophaea hybrida]
MFFLFLPTSFLHFTNGCTVEVAPSFFKVGGGKGELSKRRKNERIQPLFNRFGEGDDSWRLSAQKRQGRGGGGGTWG